MPSGTRWPTRAAATLALVAALVATVVVAAVVAAVEAAGYRGATTEMGGVARAADNPYELPRVRVWNGEAASAVLTAIAHS